ncbi:hypothetical protein ACN4EE_17100 [Geminocystis sp. CENA526]|uniref:hypothetical protein n=1 Tax=Geminocystis sp. CENA526 TaxID=1355871 RepID=UPI003D6F21C6
MANNRFQNWSKRTERLQSQALNAPSVWDNSVEEEQKNIQEVKQQWQKKQHQKFQHIQKKESESQNLQMIVSTLVGVVLMVMAFPHIPSWWQNGQNIVAGWFPEDTEANSGAQLKKGGFLDKLKKLQQKQANEENNQDETVTEDATGTNKKATIGEQLEESVDSIDKYNRDLQKAIDISEGKEVNLEEEKK